MEPVTLRTERLLLRPFAWSDVEAMYLACQDPDVQALTAMPSPYLRADAERFIGAMAPAAWAEDSSHPLGVVRLDTGVLVGCCALTKDLPGVYALGYWAAKEQRGHGYITEAARALCDWGWETLAVHRMEWWATVGNHASRAVAEKLGFTVEGTLRKRDIIDGEPRDRWVGGLLRP
jgi:RimJ/RimL family protein N-acetyltransferase